MVWLSFGSVGLLELVSFASPHAAVKSAIKRVTLKRITRFLILNSSPFLVAALPNIEALQPAWFLKPVSLSKVSKEVSWGGLLGDSWGISD